MKRLVDFGRVAVAKGGSAALGFEVDATQLMLWIQMATMEGFDNRRDVFVEDATVSLRSCPSVMNCT